MSESGGTPFAGFRLLTNADEILGLDDLARETVPTPEWGEGTGVLVQAMTATQRLAYEQAGQVTIRDGAGKFVRIDADEDRDYRTALVVCSVVDEHGEPVFSAAHVERLAAKNAAPLDRIFDVARRLSRLGNQEKEALSAGLKAKNGASPSELPVTSG